MRLPSFPTIVRTFYTISNYTARLPTQYKALSPITRGTVYKSMPTIPGFISALFSTSSSKPKMSYPVEKSDDEWRAVLSKGAYSLSP